MSVEINPWSLIGTKAIHSHLARKGLDRLLNIWLPRFQFVGPFIVH